MLALVYAHQARYADAEPLPERRWPIREKVLGPIIRMWQQV